MRSESLMPGLVIADKYAVERELGRGGMGAVYVVRHLITGKRMAMKCLLPQLAQDAELVGRFMREARAMGRMQHRHVVDIFDVGRDGEILYIVMELLQGQPLSALLHAPHITLEEVLVILLRAMDGIAAAHEVGVIHRDLKPDNIFVCIGASGRLDDPRVLDFGVSRVDDPSNPRLTRTGAAVGTPFYMPYEQLSGLHSQDQRVDVYAMGIILYEAIAGRPPFVGASFSEVAMRMLTTEPEDLNTLRPDLPRGLWPVLRRAIARQPDQRHATMRDLIAALRPFVPNVSWTSVMQGRGTPLRPSRASDADLPRTRFMSALDARDEVDAAYLHDDDDAPTPGTPLHARRAVHGLATALALVALGWWVRADALISDVASLVPVRVVPASASFASPRVEPSAGDIEAEPSRAALSAALPVPDDAVFPEPARDEAPTHVVEPPPPAESADASDAGVQTSGDAAMPHDAGTAPGSQPSARRAVAAGADPSAAPTSARAAQAKPRADLPLQTSVPAAALQPPAPPADSRSPPQGSERRAGRMGLSEF
ncbi:MAG: protein kinase [Polyangiales bacterium]